MPVVAPGLLTKKFAGKLADECADSALLTNFITAGDDIAQLYVKREYSQAVRTIMALADRANQYIDTEKPWVLVKNADNDEKLQQVCSLGINLFYILVIYLKPILPKLADDVAAFLNVPAMTWDSRKTRLDHKINRFKPLLQRIEDKQIDALKEAVMQQDEKPVVLNQHLRDAPIAEQIDIATFQQIDLRIAKIIAAEYVEGADKLLKLQVDLGDDVRQVFAGIRIAYTPEQLLGKMTLVVANLKPRKMRFGLSEGMVLAAGPGGKELWLLSPDEGAEEGMRVK